MPPSPAALTVLITGASRGLGLAMAEEYLKRGWSVIATQRGSARTGLADLADRVAGRLEIEILDIAVPEQIAALRSRLDGRAIDLLFANAGVANGPTETVGGTSTEEFFRVIGTNTLGTMRIVEALETLVPPTGTIAVMSSILGSVSANDDGGWEVYRASKAALNTLMRSFAVRHKGDPRAMLLVVPGWVRTDMGGPDADLAVEESIPAVVDMVSGETGKPGLRYLDYRGHTIPW